MATARIGVGAAPMRGHLYAGYVLAVLTLVNMMNSIDRAIMNILIEPIRHDLGFSDTQIGIVGGLGFALVYSALGFPIARLADRGPRKKLLAGGLAVWSAMTMLGGRATGFWTMLLARFGVGAGEATCYPAALSLIADYYRPAQRPRAIALFQVGLYLGFILGAAIASGIAARHGWRLAFALLGAPGLVLAVILALTVREPLRGTADASSSDTPGTATLRRVLADRSFLLLAASAALMSVGAATLANWGAAFMMRSHGLTQIQVGVTLGPVLGLGGLLGTVAGGFVGSRVARSDRRAHAPLLVMLFTAPAALPFMVLFLLAPGLGFSVAGGLLGGVLTSMHYGPLMAVALGRISAQARATASAVLILGQTVIGFGFGPLIAGSLSDALKPAYGAQSLRHAMLVAPLAVLLAWALALASWRRLALRGGEPG